MVRKIRGRAISRTVELEGKVTVHYKNDGIKPRKEEMMLEEYRRLVEPPPPPHSRARR